MAPERNGYDNQRARARYIATRGTDLHALSAEGPSKVLVCPERKFPSPLLRAYERANTEAVGCGT